MKQARTQKFAEVAKNLLCEFHTTKKQQLFTYENKMLNYHVFLFVSVSFFAEQRNEQCK